MGKGEPAIILKKKDGNKDFILKFIFFRMKIIKNDWRTRLKQDKLTDLMLVDLVSPDITEFDPTASIHLWNTSGSRMRRPYYNDSLQVIF